jgi:hypothetical protein
MGNLIDLGQEGYEQQAPMQGQTPSEPQQPMNPQQLKDALYNMTKDERASLT